LNYFQGLPNVVEQHNGIFSKTLSIKKQYRVFLKYFSIKNIIYFLY
jgi:hypothetical protein